MRRATAELSPVPPGRFDRPVVRRVVDVLLGLLLVAGALVPSSPPTGGYVFPDDVDIGTCIVAIVLAIVLAGRRRWPVAVLAVILITSVGMIALGYTMYGYMLALAVCVYEIAKRRARSATIGMSLLVIVALGIVVFLNTTGDDHFLRIVGLIAVIGFGAAAGDAVQSRRSYVGSLTERIRLAEESREQEAQRRVVEERLRIARELHDAAAHQIAVINLQAGAASAALDGNRAGDARAALGKIQSSAQSVLGEISTLLHVLRTDGRDDTLRPLRSLRDVAVLLTEFDHADLHVDLVAPSPLPVLSAATDIVAYKIIQEALTNAHKHSTDRHARVELTVAAADLGIRVSNNATDAPATGRRGHGIAGIRERVATVGGAVRVKTGPARFVLDVRIPLRPRIGDTADGLSPGMTTRQSDSESVDHASS